MQLSLKEEPYKPPKILQLDWNSFRGGLDTLLKQTEIKDTELAQADNLVLVGLGVPTKRGGTNDYFLTSPSVATGVQAVRGLKGVKFASGASGVNEILAISDFGFLVKKNGASYSLIQGYSYTSGYPAEMVQVFNNVYITNGVNNLTKYNGASIFPYTQISKPTGVTATNLSGVSGTFTRSFRISAFNAVGETIASDALLLANLPQDMTTTTVRLNWTTSSPSSVVAGYGVYGIDQGDERFITSVDSSTLRFDYKGTDPALFVFPQSADTTAGPIAKYVTTYKDKLILGNIDGFPSRIIWSGGGNNVDKFNWRFGGGYVDIDKDSGDQVMGVKEYQEAIIVFKERSIWKVTLATEGVLVIPTVQLIIRGVGTVSNRTIAYVENDLFFLSRRGVYSLGNEANYVGNILRTNEISAKVRPLFATLSQNQLGQACAAYQNNKYRLSYPAAGSMVNTREVIYDRERLAWMGPNNFPGTPAIYEVYYDGANNEKLVWGDANDTFVTDMDDNYINDKGVKIQTILLTKKTAFSNTFKFKRVKEIYSNWRSVFGSPFVNIILETRSGAVGTAQSFTISASNAGVGWGFDKWGTFRWGTSGGAGSSAGSNDLAKRTKVNKIGRTVQIEITTSGVNDRYELLSIQLNAQELGKGLIPSTWNTS